MEKESGRKLTFSMMYFYKDRYLLPFSHDEVVHGKATILNKMNGQYEDKFPQARAMYLYMMVHPGKKLNFMGNEIGQFREWDEKREQDWDLTSYPAHDAFRRYMTDLNQIYLTHSALWADDYDQKGFRWIDCHQEEKCVYILERRSREESKIMGIACIGCGIPMVEITEAGAGTSFGMYRLHLHTEPGIMRSYRIWVL